MNATVPLEEALPWSPETPRKILICDSIETDGSFLLHTFAAQILNDHSGSGGDGNRLWWLTARPVTDRQIASALKKIGCTVAASYLRNLPSGSGNAPMASHPTTGPLKITSLASDIASKILESTTTTSTDGVHEVFDGENYLKDVYKKIKEWATTSDGLEGDARTYWVFLDDVSALATMLGDEGLVYQFVDTIHSLRTRKKNFGSIVRCSYELDQTILKASRFDETQDKTGWLGAGGMAQKQETKQVRQNWIPWERTIESMDIVVDVVPLSTGYSREAHGRLVFSEYPGGRGWGGTAPGSKTKQGSTAAPSTSTWNKFVINYCLQDNGVRAIRLRESSSSST